MTSDETEAGRVLSENDQQKLEALYRSIPEDESFEKRLLAVSEQFLGCKYGVHPLIGSVSEPERFVASLADFDCVTFCEVVLAILNSSDPESFCQTLKELRYEHAMINWLDRNHYSVDWIERNQKKGFVCRLELSERANVVARELCALEGYPRKDVTLRFIPLSELEVFYNQLRSGDLIYFGTTREHLDVLHLGFLVKVDGELWLRHASKQKGEVLDELLSEFLARYGECPGVILARPAAEKIEK